MLHLQKKNSQKNLLKIKIIAILLFCTEMKNQLMLLKEIVKKKKKRKNADYFFDQDQNDNFVLKYF